MLGLASVLLIGSTPFRVHKPKLVRDPPVSFVVKKPRLGMALSAHFSNNEARLDIVQAKSLRKYAQGHGLVWPKLVPWVR